MAVFTVHAPEGGDPAAPGNAERVVFVKEGFSLLAFLLPLVWLLWQRAWLALLIYLAGLALVTGAAWGLGTPPPFAALANTLYSLLFGLEAAAIRQWTLARRGFRQVASVLAANKEEAELKFFTAWRPQRPSFTATAAVLPPAPPPPVVGLFPEPGQPR